MTFKYILSTLCKVYGLIPKIKISVSTDISIFEFYGYIGDISMNIFT